MAAERRLMPACGCGPISGCPVGHMLFKSGSGVPLLLHLEYAMERAMKQERRERRRKAQKCGHSKQ